MKRQITAFGSSEGDVKSKIEVELVKYEKYSIEEMKIIGPARTEGGGTQFTGVCIISVH